MKGKGKMTQQLYKKFYSVSEFYTILYEGLRTIPFLRENKKNGSMSNHFIERIMLAVTEVNGCEVCSYEHTKIALKQGMKEEEIKMLLSGTTENIPSDELPAVMFAQHYADTKGKPDEDAWQTIVTTYGKKKALGILGAIRMIMIGNSYGIALSAFKSRLKGKRIEKSNVGYELKMLLSILFLLPISLIHILLSKVKKSPVITFA